MSTTLNDKAAEYFLLDQYDRARRPMGHDYGGAQRYKELRRLERELDSLAGSDAWRLLEWDTGSPVLLAAWDRVAAPRLARLEDEGYRANTPASSRSRRAWAIVARYIGATCAYCKTPSVRRELEEGKVAHVCPNDNCPNVFVRFELEPPAAEPAPEFRATGYGIDAADGSSTEERARPAGDNGPGVFGLELPRSEHRPRRDCVGRVENTPAGNVALRIGHETGPRLGPVEVNGWSQVGYIVLTPAEARELAKKIEGLAAWAEPEDVAGDLAGQAYEAGS